MNRIQNCLFFLSLVLRKHFLYKPFPFSHNTLFKFIQNRNTSYSYSTVIFVFKNVKVIVDAISLTSCVVLRLNLSVL